MGQWDNGDAVMSYKDDMVEISYVDLETLRNNDYELTEENIRLKNQNKKLKDILKNLVEDIDTPPNPNWTSLNKAKKILGEN